MNVGCFSLGCLAFAALMASPAFADNDPAPTAKKTPAQARHAKSVATAPGQSGSLPDIEFSDPYAPPGGAAQASKGDFAPAANGAPKEPAGGISFGLKWHANNAQNNLYEHVLPRASPDGPGDAVEGGIKLGF